jgi:hypothetical protein
MEADMKGVTLRLFAILFVQTLAITPLAEAQDVPDLDGLSRAVLAVPSNVVESRRFVDGNLYEGTIVATISDRDGNPENFADTDRIRFTIRPRSGQGQTLVFPGETRADFEEWARANASSLFGIIFPAGLSGVLGRGAGEIQAQQVLLTTALATESAREMSQGGRSIAGGLFEYEVFTRDGRRPGDSARAWQGLYNMSKSVSLQGRYVQQREGFTTNAMAFSVDVHPYAEIDGPIRWRIGGTARSGLLYSQSNAMDLGSIEFGGGGFVSAFKDLGPVRIGGGTILQASKSYIPPIFSEDEENDLAFLADAINARGIQYDISYGATAGVDTSSRTTVIVKVLKNQPLSSSDVRPDSWLVQSGLSYRFGLPSVNAGYKYYSTTGLHSHSVFVMGNFNW